MYCILALQQDLGCYYGIYCNNFAFVITFLVVISHSGTFQLVFGKYRAVARIRVILCGPHMAPRNFGSGGPYEAMIVTKDFHK